MKLRIAIFPTVGAIETGRFATLSVAGRQLYGAAVATADVDGFIAAFNDPSADSRCSISNHRARAFKWESGIAVIFVDTEELGYGETRRLILFTAANPSTAVPPTSGAVGANAMPDFAFRDVETWTGSYVGWIRNSNALAALAAAFAAGRVTA